MKNKKYLNSEWFTTDFNNVYKINGKNGVFYNIKITDTLSFAVDKIYENKYDDNLVNVRIKVEPVERTFKVYDKISKTNKDYNIDSFLMLINLPSSNLKKQTSVKRTRAHLFN